MESITNEEEPVEETSSKDSKTKLMLIVMIVAVLFLIAATIFLFIKSRKLENQLNGNLVGTSATATVVASKTLTTSKTPTATARASKTVEKTTEPTVSVSDTDLITKAVADKFSKSVSEVSVTISKKDANNAFGGVTINGEMGGGYFVAVKQGSEWIIIADGNGTIECSVLDQYSVPASIVGECFNSDTQESVTR